MLTKTLSIALVFMTMHSVYRAEPASANSKVDKQTRFAEKVRDGVLKLGIGEKSRIQVKLADGAKLAGYIREASDDSFVVVDTSIGSATTVAYANVAQVQGRNLTTGKRIIIGLVVFVGMVTLFALLFAPKS